MNKMIKSHPIQLGAKNILLVLPSSLKSNYETNLSRGSSVLIRTYKQLFLLYVYIKLPLSMSFPSWSFSSLFCISVNPYSFPLSSPSSPLSLIIFIPLPCHPPFLPMYPYNMFNPFSHLSFVDLPRAIVVIWFITCHISSLFYHHSP